MVIRFKPLAGQRYHLDLNYVFALEMGQLFWLPLLETLELTLELSSKHGEMIYYPSDQSVPNMTLNP